MYNFKSVTELNQYTDDLLNADDRLSALAVTGEISGLTIYRNSGHCYFTLKDNASQVSCVMFSNYLNKLNFIPKDGMKVLLVGSASVYKASGRFQIKVFNMRRDGIGELYEQYRELFAKLNEEGLFAPEHKRAIPLLLRRIGVVTSPMGAVIHDIISTLRQRNPYFDILIYPSAVQGERCASEVEEGIRYLSDSGKVDVIIVARGGGSFEEIFGYSDERVVRAVYDSRVPVITAIGHEVHSPLCDYASDMRAATPTQAAELVLGQYDVMYAEAEGKRELMELSVKAYLDGQKRRIDYLKNHKALESPRFYTDSQLKVIEGIRHELIIKGLKFLNVKSNELTGLDDGLHNAFYNEFDNRKRTVAGFIDKLELLGPTNVLRRGFAYVNNEHGAVTSVRQVDKGDMVDIVFSDGVVAAKVDRIIGKEE